MRTRISLVLLPALVAAAAAVSTACTTNPGIPPPLRRFHFPTAAAISPDSNFLYVVNSDFNLEFNGGTVVAVDLSLVRAAMNACPGHVCPPPLPPSAMPSTSSTVNPPCSEAQPPDSPLEPEAAFIPTSGGTVRINPYATDAALRVDPATGRQRLYVTVRGDGTLTWIDVDQESGHASLSCGLPTNCAGARIEGELCADSHRIGADPGRNSPRRLTMPALPVAVNADPDGFVVVAHQDPSAGRVSLYYDPFDGGGPVLAHWITDMPPSLDAIVRINFPSAAATEQPYWYAFSRDFTEISHVRAIPDGPNSTVYFARASAAPGLASDVGVRAVVRDPRPGRPYVYAVARQGRPRSGSTQHSGESLIRYDFTDRQNPTAIDILEMPIGVSRVAAVVDPSVPNSQAHLMLYVVAYDSRKLYVVDADEWRVVDQIRTQLGPQTIIADPSLAPDFMGAARQPYVYVVDFAASCVEVINVDRSDPDGRYHQVVFTIGDPGRPRETL
jgi:hypothetical protein